MARRPIPIRAELGADTHKFKRGLAQAKGDLDRTARQWQTTLRGVSAAMGAAFGTAAVHLTTRALDQAAKSAINYADGIGKAARAAGVAPRTLQELRFAAQRAGGSIEGMDSSLVRFTKNLGEARVGTGQLKTLLERIDPELFGRLMGASTTDEALDMVLDRLARSKDAMERNALAMAAFGRSGGQAMAELAANAEEARARFRELGLGVGDDLVANAERAQDRLTELDSVLKDRLHATVLRNVDAFIAWKEAINGVQVALVDAVGASHGAARGLAARVALPGIDAEIRMMEQHLAQRGSLPPEALTELERLRRERQRIGSFTSGAPFGTLAEMQKALEARPPAAGAAPAGGAAPALPGFRGGMPTLKADAIRKNADEAAKAIEQMVAKTRTPLEEFQAHLTEIERLRPFAQTADDMEALDRAAAAARDGIRNLDGARHAIDQWGRSISDSLADAVIWGERLDRVFAGLIKQLASRALSNFIFNAVGGALGGGAFNIAGARAMGGPVAAGRNYIVGERGPELFTPSVNGTIIPGDAGGGGVTVNMGGLHFDVGLETVEDRIASMTPGIAASVVQAVQKIQRRPGFA